MAAKLGKLKSLFIDCGGYDGCSVRKFRKEFDPNNQYHIVSFEANKKFKDCYNDFSDHEFYNKAVWVYDGSIDFFLDQKKGYGSSVIKEKKTGRLDKENPDKVECIRLSAFVDSMAKQFDQIILKLDIEGAEYAVLKDMLDTGVINRVSRLMIEWHYKKVNVPEEEHNALLEKLRDVGISIEDWNAIGY